MYVPILFNISVPHAHIFLSIGLVQNSIPIIIKETVPSQPSISALRKLITNAKHTIFKNIKNVQYTAKLTKLSFSIHENGSIRV